MKLEKYVTISLPLPDRLNSTSTWLAAGKGRVRRSSWEKRLIGLNHKKKWKRLGQGFSGRVLDCTMTTKHDGNEKIHFQTFRVRFLSSRPFVLRPRPVVKDQSQWLMGVKVSRTHSLKHEQCSIPPIWFPRRSFCSLCCAKRSLAKFQEGESVTAKQIQRTDDNLINLIFASLLNIFTVFTFKFARHISRIIIPEKTRLKLRI